MREILISFIELYKRGIDPDTLTNLSSDNTAEIITTMLFPAVAQILAFVLFITIIIIFIKVRKKGKTVTRLPFAGMVLEILMLLTYIVPSYVFDSSAFDIPKFSPALLWLFSEYHAIFMVTHLIFVSFGIAKWLKSGILGQKHLVLPRLNSIFHAVYLALPLINFKDLSSNSLYDIEAYPTPVYIIGFFLCAAVFIVSIFAESFIKKKLKNDKQHQEEIAKSPEAEENSLSTASDHQTI